MSNDRYDGTEGNGYQPNSKPLPDDNVKPEPPPSRLIKEHVEKPEPTPAPPPRDPSGNLRALQFDHSDMEKACAYMERNLEAMTRYQRSYARLQRERFVSLVAVGFTPEQALEVICRTSMFGS